MNSGTGEEIIRYHEATKHHYDRYARSPGYMDWQNQPTRFALMMARPYPCR